MPLSFYLCRKTTKKSYPKKGMIHTTSLSKKQRIGKKYFEKQSKNNFAWIIWSGEYPNGEKEICIV